MTTEARIHANRLNAQKSTGPNTPQGKAVVSQNALKHGLSARHDVVITESQADFDLHRDALLAELDPLSPMESILADRIVSLSWRLKRADLIQNQAIDALTEEDATNPLAKLAKSFGLKGLPLPQPDPADSNPDLILGRIALKDFSNARVLDRLLMYERRIEHSLYKTTLELQRLRLLRNLEPSEPNLEPQDRYLAPGPVPGGSTEPNNTPVAERIEYQESRIENPESSTEYQESSIIAQNKPNFKIPKTNATPCTPCHSDRSPAGAKRRNLFQHSRPSQTTELAQCAAESSSCIAQNKPNVKIGNINISTARTKAYTNKQPTMNSERYPKQTQSNPKLSPPGRNPALSEVEGTRYEPCTIPAGQP